MYGFTDKTRINVICMCCRETVIRQRHRITNRGTRFRVEVSPLLDDYACRLSHEVQVRILCIVRSLDTRLCLREETESKANVYVAEIMSSGYTKRTIVISVVVFAQRFTKISAIRCGRFSQKRLFLETVEWLSDRIKF